MRITINGQTKNIDGNQNIAAMVEGLGANKKHIIAELNGTIVPGTDWAGTLLKDGDTIELVAFVGGG